MPLIPYPVVNQIHTAPLGPGVYIFKDRIGSVLYIGKAINLRRRLSYYAKEENELYEKTAQFLKLAKKLDWIEVKSDIEALLLEMNLIRNLKPKYNIISKDDKRPLFVHFTNDEIPRVRTARMEIPGTGEYIGPFPSGYRLGFLLKKLRHIFPYCSCSPSRRTSCMYVDLGLCPDPSKLKTPQQKATYTRTVNKLKMFLRGEVSNVIKLLEKDMRALSQKLEYEKAQDVKRQITAIQLLLEQPGSLNDYFTDNSIRHHLSQSQWKATQLYFKLPFLTRIEGYDIANTSGQMATASMVVLDNGYANSSEYRKFKIYGIEGPNDPLMIYHTLTRRLRHEEWEIPQLILIDGGKTQVRAAQKALKEASIDIRIVGLAKRFEQLVIPEGREIRVVSLPMDNPVLTLLRSVRDEAHRFTTTYHKKLREKNILKSTK